MWRTKSSQPGTSEDMKNNDNLADDLLDGVTEIGAFLGWTERRTYYAAEHRIIPVFKMGKRKWCARKSTLRQHIADLEATDLAS
jgi:hypothetical protein